MLGERLLGGEWRCPVARRALVARTEPPHAYVRVSVLDAEQANPVILPSLAPTLVARGRVVSSTPSIAGTRTNGERAPPLIDPPGDARHRPEQTLTYQLIVRHYPAVLA